MCPRLEGDVPDDLEAAEYHRTNMVTPPRDKKRDIISSSPPIAAYSVKVQRNLTNSPNQYP